MSDEIQWRRRWHPDLKACSWQPLKIDSGQFLVKSKFTHGSCEIFLTDLVWFWYEKLSETALKKRIEKLNPSIEAPVTKILDLIKGNLEKPSKGTALSVVLKSHGEGDRQTLVLTIDSQLAGMPFSWNFICQSVEVSMISDHLTKPLLVMVAELSRRQQELIKIIMAKDKQIDDYKSQGVSVSRKYYETVLFDETAFKNSMMVSKDFETLVKNFGAAVFNEDSQNLYHEIMTKYSWLHHSPAKDELSDSLEDDDSLNAGVNSGASIPSWTDRLPLSAATGKTASPNSPTKSPVSDESPVKNVELLRRQALERRLEEEDKKKKLEKSKKKKKIAF